MKNINTEAQITPVPELADCACVMPDASMEPALKAGDLLYISFRLPAPADGSICAVALDDEKIAIGRVYDTPDGLWLKFDNPAFPPQLLTDAEVAGQIVGYTRRLF